MTNLMTMERKQLQELAKQNNIPANLSNENLIRILGALLGANAITVEEATPVEPQQTDLSSVFAQFLPQDEPQERVITSHRDLNFTGYVSDGIASYCFKLYTNHGLDVRELDGKNYAFIKGEVDRLNALPFPPSPKQRETISNLIVELQELNPEFNVPLDVLSSLTGGQDGTAGHFIQFLYQQRNEFSLKAPLSDAQADKLTEWFFCPDIPWDDFGIKVNKPYPTELNPNGWMLLSPDEFKQELKEKMTKEQASEFIGANKDKYYQWKATRVSDYQAQTIRQLEERLAGISKLGVKTFAVIDGVVQEVYKKPQREWNPQAYQPLEEFHLQQMDKETASKYIRQLESEVSNRERSAVEDTDMQRDLEAKRNKLKSSSDKVNSNTQEYQALVDLVFGLEAVAGQENDELHESISELMVQKKGNPVDVAQQLYEFMQYLLERRFIAFGNLVEMCQNSNIATKILEIKYPKQYDEAINGKSTPQQQEAKREATVQQANNKVMDFMNQFKK